VVRQKPPFARDPSPLEMVDEQVQIERRIFDDLLRIPYDHFTMIARLCLPVNHIRPY
jgi:hypothetical protein